MKVINRAVAIIKPTQAYLDWANSLPDPLEDFTLEDLRTDCTAILIPEYDYNADSEAFIKSIYPMIFEMELESWERDRSKWTMKRDYETFRKWFDVEIHSTVIDASEEELTREEY